MTSTTSIGSNPPHPGPRIPNNNYSTPQKTGFKKPYPSYLPSPIYKPIKFREGDVPLRETDRSKEVNTALKDLALEIVECTIAIFFALSNPELFCASVAVGFLAKRVLSSTANKIQDKLYPCVKWMNEIPVIPVYYAVLIHVAIYIKVNTYAINRLGAIVLGVRCGKLIADMIPHQHRKMADVINSVTSNIMKKLKSLKSKKIKPVEVKAPTVP